jgi:hypothetical protein
MPKAVSHQATDKARQLAKENVGVGDCDGTQDQPEKRTHAPQQKTESTPTS